MIVRRAAMSSSVGSSKDTPRDEENVATSRLAATMSAYLLTDQKPEPSSGDQATGASRRSRPNSRMAPRGPTCQDRLDRQCSDLYHGA
jgi:hypothetical protein